MELGKALTWISPECFVLSVRLGALQPNCWGVAVDDDLGCTLSSSPRHGLDRKAGCTFPEHHTVLAAGVVQSSIDGGISGPRSVVVTVSSPGSQINAATIGSSILALRHNVGRDGSDPRQVPTIHIWALNVRRCLQHDGPGSAGVHPSNTPPGRQNHKPDNLNDPLHGDQPAVSFGAARDYDSAHQLPRISLTEVARLPLPQGVTIPWPASSHDPRSTAHSGGTVPLGGADGVSTPSVTATARLGCVLADSGAWAALHVSPVRVLLLGFEAALKPGRPGDYPAASAAEALAANAPGWAPGGSDAVQLEGGALGGLLCMDLDLSAAAPHGGRILACCACGGRVVLDVAVPCGDGGDAGGAGGGAAAAAIGPDGACHQVGQSLLLRLSFPLDSPSRVMRVGGETAKNGAATAVTQSALATDKLNSVRSGSSAGAVVSSVRLEGPITVSCPLPRLTHGSRITYPRATTAGPPTLVAGNGNSLVLIVPQTAVLGAGGPLAQAVKREGLSGSPSSARRPEPDMTLAELAQLSLPGPVQVIHPLPRIHLRSSSSHSSSGSGVSGQGQSTRDKGRTANSGDVRDGLAELRASKDFPPLNVPASRAAFAAVHCSDPARSLTVLRVLCRRATQIRIHPPAAVGEAATRGPADAAMAVDALADISSLSWSLQQLLVIRNIHELLPVPLPSALSLALVAPGAANLYSNAATGGDGGCGGAVLSGGAVLASAAAVMVVAAGEEARTERAGCGGKQDCDDVQMQDASETDDDVMQTGEEDEDDCGNMFTQRPPQLRKQQQQARRQRKQQPGAVSGGHAGGFIHKDGKGITALGPVRLGPWSPALVLPADVQPLPPQVLLPAGGSSPGSAAASPFAAGVVARVSVLDQDAGLKQQGQPPGWQQQQEEWGQQGGYHQQQQQWVMAGQRKGGATPGPCGGDEASAQEAGMAKVLAHMARRWDTGVHHALEQRATLGRMVHLTQETEQLLEEAGRQPLPTRGSAGARPPCRAALLDHIVDLEAQLILLHQNQRQQQCQAQDGGRADGAADGADGGGAAGGSAAVDRLLDQLLLGAGPAAQAHDGVAVVAGVTAGRGGGAGAAVSGATAGKPLAATASVGPPAAAACAQRGLPDGGSSWSLALESLTQARQGGDWVLQALIRLDNSHGSGPCEPPADATAAAARQPQPPAKPPAALHLDDVALLLYCPDGLPLAHVRGRWTAVQRAQRRVAVEVAVPLGDLLGLAAVRSAPTSGGLTGPGFSTRSGGTGAGLRGAAHSRQHDLQVALGPLPGLFDASGDSGSDSAYDSDSESGSDRDGSSLSDTEGVNGYAGTWRGAAGAVGSGGLADIGGGTWPAREVLLGAVVRVTARNPSPSAALGPRGACRCGEGKGGGRNSGGGGGPGASGVCPSCAGRDGAGLLQVRTLDLGHVRVCLDSLLTHRAPGATTQHHPDPHPPPQRQPQQEAGVSRFMGLDDGGSCGGGGGGVSMAAVGGSHGGGNSGSGPAALPPGALLRPSRSLLLLAVTPAEAQAMGLQDATGSSDAGWVGAAWDGPCPSVPRGLAGTGDRAPAGGSMWRDLKARLLSTSGFGAAARDLPGGGDLRPGDGGSGHPAAAEALVWEAPMGWQCAVSLAPYGVDGCEVQLSYLGVVTGGAADGWSGAALDQVQWAVTRAAEGWCEEAGRHLAVLAPDPLADPELERLDAAAGALQRCVDTTLELFEQTLLAQQLQHQQPGKRQPDRARERGQHPKPVPAHNNAGASVGEVDGLGGPAGGGADLQAMLEEVLQLRLQLSTAMETYLAT